jgi:hypothetical protein
MEKGGTQEEEAKGRKRAAVNRRKGFVEGGVRKGGPRGWKGGGGLGGGDWDLRQRCTETEGDEWERE